MRPLPLSLSLYLLLSATVLSAESPSAGTQRDAAAAFGGESWIAAWSQIEPDGTERVFIAPFEPDGERVDRQAVAVPFRGHPQRYPSIAFDGVSFLLVWVDGTSVLAARYSPAGERLDEPFVLGDHAQTGTTALAWSGTSWIAVWSESDRNLHMRRVTSSGELLDPSDLRFPQTPASRGDAAPVIDCQEGMCLLAWLAAIAECQLTCPPPPPSVRATRISPELERLDPEPLPIAWQGGPLSISSRNGVWLVTWSQPGGRRVDRTGRILDPEVPHGPDDYVPFAPVSAVSSFPTADAWLVAWDLGGPHGILSTRTTDGFSPLDFLDAQTSTRLPANASHPRYGNGPEPVLLYVAPVAATEESVDRLFAVRPATSDQSDFGPILRLSSIVGGVELEWTVGGEPVALWINHVDSTGAWERIVLLWYGVDLTEGRSSLTVPLDRSMAHRFVMTAIYAPGSGLVSNDVTIGTSRRRSVRR